MTTSEKLQQVESILIKVSALWFAKGHSKAELSLTREERDVVAASLEIAAGICTLFSKPRK